MTPLINSFEGMAIYIYIFLCFFTWTFMDPTLSLFSSFLFIHYKKSLTSDATTF
jgi:Co/Zn/Cd efflux system component